MYGGVNDVNLNSVVVSRVRGLAVLKLLASDLERMPISEILSSQSLKLSLEFVSHIGKPLRQVAGKFFGTILD